MLHFWFKLTSKISLKKTTLKKPGGTYRARSTVFTTAFTESRDWRPNKPQAVSTWRGAAHTDRCIKVSMTSKCRQSDQKAGGFRGTLMSWQQSVCERRFKSISLCVLLCSNPRSYFTNWFSFTLIRLHFKCRIYK